jgi:hypothetical protein
VVGDRSAVFLSAALFVLTAAAAAVLVSEAVGRRERPAAEFQHLVGGLGCGPALDLARCPFAFDPRLAGVCQGEGGPVPGGACFCPYHAGAVFFSPPRERDGDAPPP